MASVDQGQMSRAHAEGRTFYSFPDAAPWEDSDFGGWISLWLPRPLLYAPQAPERSEAV